MTNLETSINKRVFEFFLESSDYNGIPLRKISQEFAIEYEYSIDIIISLVQKNLVSIQSSTNPHIIGFRHYPIDQQVKILEEAKSITEEVISMGPEISISIERSEYPICLYPSQDSLRKNRDLTAFGNAEYSKSLAIGEPQLSPAFFEFEVLDRYFNDPRFEFSLDDYSGHISCKYDENDNPILRDEDQIFLKTFGLGYNQSNERLAVVFHRYLNNLTPDHQAYWRSKQVFGDNKMIEEYHQNSIEGKWTKSYSVFSAFTLEHNALNELSKLIFGTALFNKIFLGGNRPREFTFLFSPTTKNYNEFILLLDKMLSDNINSEFFENRIDLYEYVTSKSGEQERRRKGTLSLFEEWLSSFYHLPQGDSLADLFKPFRRVRKDRQNPAHKIQENTYDKNLWTLQKQHIQECYSAISTIRMIFQKHPKGKSYQMPEGYDESLVKMF